VGALWRGLEWLLFWFIVAAFGVAWCMAIIASTLRELWQAIA
jgi:hypothetical protein